MSLTVKETITIDSGRVHEIFSYAMSLNARNTRWN